MSDLKLFVPLITCISGRRPNLPPVSSTTPVSVSVSRILNIHFTVYLYIMLFKLAIVTFS